MHRLLMFLVLAVLPLFAAAHEGHRHAAASLEANGTIKAVVAAPSHCPGGEENCCCHDLTCTSSFQPAAIAAAGQRVAPAPIRFALPCPVPSAPRTHAAARHSPRGPPLLS
jgi:hypothetical protein